MIGRILAWLTDGTHWQGDDGILRRTTEHLGYSLTALLIAALLAIPLGLYIGHSGRGRFLVVNAVGAARAIPSLGLLLLAVLWLGPKLSGDLAFLAPAGLVLVVLAIPPILSGAYAGVEGVDPDARDAAKGMGMRGREVLRHVELPCALPLIMSGIRSATLQVIATATIAAVVGLGGLGRFHGRSVVVLGTEKGSDTESRVRHNFGMARPEGYRKARRLMELAGRFNLPILTFIDTSGAFPGIDAEARGQAEAIARSIEACLDAPVPLVATIIGEGGSGGAIALATADQILMLEYAIYSVISPEGCASILWRDAAQAPVAAEALKLTAEDLLKLKLVDQVIPEPLGGAQRDKQATLRAVDEAIQTALAGLDGVEAPALRSRRREKFLAMGRETIA
jgi:acetyl-CoA carboxylase carboxyl transferase subunit alpha